MELDLINVGLCLACPQVKFNRTSSPMWDSICGTSGIP